MVFAYHLILSCYGFWLPNDPRGSWSQCVRNYELHRFGPATTVSTRRSLADQPFDPALRERMRLALKHRPVRFNGQQARRVATGFAQACLESQYTVHACAILPNHVHLVVARHDRQIERIANHLKARATHQLNKAGINPLPRSPWSRGRWAVYLDSHRQVRNAIRYTNRNPTRDGLKPQRWKFVTPHPACPHAYPA